MAPRRVRVAKPTDHDHEDVVVDTNVLAHSENGASVHRATCLEFILWLVDDPQRLWVLDDTGKARPAVETSVLWAEYNETLSSTSTSMLLFQQLLASERVCFAARPKRDLRELIQDIIPRNQRDRAILGAACGSGSRWLVTHDDDDFDAPARLRCQRELAVQVTDTEARSAA